MRDVLAFKLFTRVARLGSFSAAAREQGLVQSQVSRMVAELESSLGTRLLSRTTRAVAPTEAGLAFLARMEPILVAIEDAENSVRESNDIRGVLRLGMPSTMAIRIVLPRLSRFADSHPRLHVDVLLADDWQDMVREAVDVGIRVGRLPDTAGTSLVIGKMQRVIVASPVYLARHGTPKTPMELAGHRIVGGPAAARSSSWRFERDGEVVTTDVQPIISTNDTAGALAAAAGGLGITSTTSWASEKELAEGTLVRLLTDWKTTELSVHAYFPMGRATRAAARAFVDFLARDLAATPPGVATAVAPVRAAQRSVRRNRQARRS